ncbi:MAG: sensor histidine kinase [Labilithrix sp.]|nr:sensor histidine kinase [Labilithrix sp.]
MTETIVESAEVNLKILWSLARWLEDVHGKPALTRVARKAGVDEAQLDGATHWSSLEPIELFMAGARELCGTDEEFVRACAHRFAESYGPVRYMVWALSEQQFFEAAAKMSKLMTRVSRFEVLRASRNEFHVRYHAEKKESRLMCLSRQAAWAYGPTMWGMPPAELTEQACIAHGDAFCEYSLRWFDRRRLFPILGGVGLGAALSVGLAAIHTPVSGGVVLPILGAALGYIYELRRAQRANLGVGQEMNQALRDLGAAEAEARSEVVDMHRRQREWIRLMEQQVTERTTTLERIVEGLDGLQQSRVTTIRGFSHDLRNPLFVVRGNTQFLRERFTDGDEGDALRDMEAAALQIEAMLSRLMEVATAETGFVKLTPRPLVVAPLAETFRRRLKALVHGRDIKVSVFSTREAPDEIVIDPLVFDRVVDNLLTNAAKYTDRGSILLEISGTPGSGPMTPGAAADAPSHPGYLTLKLSDTGQGIQPAAVERIFRPRPADEPSERADSYGIGLSSAVRLLAQIGGRLDVMSKPSVGTTFWAHFPARPPEQKRGAAVDDNLESMITRVVTIRRAEGT